jgi:hypothetical protein
LLLLVVNEEQEAKQTQEEDTCLTRLKKQNHADDAATEAAKTNRSPHLLRLIAQLRLNNIKRPPLLKLLLANQHWRVILMRGRQIPTGNESRYQQMKI